MQKKEPGEVTLQDSMTQNKTKEIQGQVLWTGSEQDSRTAGWKAQQHPYIGRQK